MSEFFISVICNDFENFSVKIEDDGRVAYAYLLEDTTIVGDVWLYNQLDTPTVGAWDRSQMPFLNPIDFVDGRTIRPILNNSDVEIKWEYLNESIEARVFIRKELVAILRPNELPSWSLFVRKDGPLARKWVS